MNDSPLQSLLGRTKEGLSALRNFATLLASVRVSPRAVAEVLPDVRVACPEMLRHATEFVAVCNRAPGVGSAPAEVLEVVRKCVDDLAEALAYEGRTLPAATRLNLERRFRSRVTELDAALDLFELLSLAASHVPARVNLVELVTQCRTGDQPGGPGTGSISMPIIARTDEILVQASPRLTYGILGIAAAVVAERVPQNVALELIVGSGECVARLAAREPDSDVLGPELILALPKAIRPSRACAESCARSTGCQWEILPEEPAVQLRWPM